MKLPNMITNPPIPHSVYKKMKEDERYDNEIELLKNNYNQLLELTKLKDKEIESSKKYNRIMLIVAIISMFVAIAALVTPLLLTGGAK